MDKKVVIVSGATSGIGRATAILFAESDYQVVAIGRRQKEIELLKEEITANGGSVETVFADIRETSQVERIVIKIAETYGSIDVLVNAAGIIANGSIENTSLEDWDKMMNINLRSVFFLMQKCIPHLEKSKGNVVNVSSVAGLRSFPGVLAYCVSKAAIDQLTRCSALELAPKGVRVNAVNPGVVETNLHKKSGMDEEQYAAFLEHSKTTHPIGRVGQPKEIADLIYFLASEKAGWITGGTYEIDGGRGQTCAR